MKGKNTYLKNCMIFIVTFLLFTVGADADQIKLKVIVDNATVKSTPSLSGNTIARIPLNTIIDAQEKSGEWYQVTIESEGMMLSGFIHEVLVEVTTAAEAAGAGEEPAGGVKSQDQILAEIQLKIDEGKGLVRQGENLENAVNLLRPLVAKAFNITEDKIQKELAAEIFLWIGLAYAGQGDGMSALAEFKNMFEVNHSHSKEITRNIYDTEVAGLIQHAEKDYLGLLIEYSLDISTEPTEAKILVNGRDVGTSPEIYRTSAPQLVLEIQKDGYAPIREELFLTSETTQKSYTLEKLGREVQVRSIPVGAKIFLDGEDTGQVTDSVLPFVTFGPRRFSFQKANYASREKTVEIIAGEGPQAVEAVLSASRYQYVRKWGGPALKNFKFPKGVAVDKDNNFYVVDEGGSKLQKFDASGRTQAGFGNAGKEFKPLRIPAGIAIDSQGNLYVTDSRTHTVSKFDKSGKFIKKWGREGNQQDAFDTPTGICVDKNNDVYVVDSGNGRIKKYSSQGILKKVWGKTGTAQGSFVNAADVAVNQANEVFVLDRARVQKFSSEGEFISSWGKAGRNDGDLNKPMGIFIDQYGDIYITDTGNSRIQKFAPNGQFIAKWGTAGVANNQLNFPIGIAVDSRGFVYVVERENNRVQQFGVPR
jgi:DNA-binding beta-propeller fold protein YncE